MFCVRSLFCSAELCVLSSFAFRLLRKRELVALILLFSECQLIPCYCSLLLPRSAVAFLAHTQLTFWHIENCTLMSHLTNRFISIRTSQSVLYETSLK